MKNIKLMIIAVAILFGACKNTINNKTTPSVNNTGTIVDLASGTSDSFENMQEKAENLSKGLNNLFTKKELELAQAQLLKMNLSIEQTNQILPLLADVAAKAHKPLADITEAVGKGISEGRMSGQLTDLGIKFGNTGDMANRFNSAVNGMQKYAGAASESLDELSNRAKMNANNIEESQEKIGGAVAGAWETTKAFFSNGVVDMFDVEKWKDAFSGSEGLKEKVKDEALKAAKEKEQERINELVKYESEAIAEATGIGGETKGFGYLTKLNDEELNVRKENAENNLKSEILAQDKLIGVKKQYGQLDLNREVHEIEKVLDARKKANEDLLALYKAYAASLEAIKKQDVDDAMKFQIDAINDEWEKKIAEEDENFRKELKIVDERKKKLEEIAKKGNSSQRKEANAELEKIYKVEELSLEKHNNNLENIDKDYDKKKKEEDEKGKQEAMKRERRW
jgi:hypothetical protein